MKLLKRVIFVAVVVKLIACILLVLIYGLADASTVERNSLSFTSTDSVTQEK